LIFTRRLQDRIQQLLETVGALREELRDSFKSSQVALSSMTVERREWQVLEGMVVIV
jgi:hypothetical protein